MANETEMVNDSTYIDVSSDKDYTEEFLQAIDVMIKARLKEVNFDTTVECTVLDASEAKTGYRYWVSNGSAKFYAYSDNTSYYEGDTVYVSIPNNDYNKEKIIIGKKVNTGTSPYIFVRPFDTYLDITGNLLTGENRNNLLANDPDVTEVMIWSWPQTDEDLEAHPYDGFDRIGITAQFEALLRDLKTVKGEYGLRLEMQTDQTTNEKVLDSNGQPQLVDTVFYFSTNDMYGNPYDFDSFYDQQKVWYMPEGLGAIQSLKLYFYQKPGSFLNSDNQPIPYKENEDFLIEAINKLAPNIFVKDIYLSFGYNIEEFEDNGLILYSPNAKEYQSIGEFQDPSNDKIIYLRWVHRIENGNLRQGTVADLGENDWIRWYHYNYGSPPADVWSGVYWQEICQNQNCGKYIAPDISGVMVCDCNGEHNHQAFSYVLHPDVSIKQEQVKVIASIDGKIYKSNVITFTNSDEKLIDVPTTKSLLDFDIVCEDGTYGNYFIYELGGSLLNRDESTIKRTLSLYLEQSVLNNDVQYIQWKIPAQYTMITLAPEQMSTDVRLGRYYEADSDPNFVYLTYDFDTGNGVVPKEDRCLTLDYYINPFFSTNNSNNTISCNIIYYGRTYQTSRVMRFGPAGTSGTDVTLVISLGPGENAVPNDGTTIEATAYLYDANNAVVDFEDAARRNIDLNFEWGWRNSNNSLMAIESIEDCEYKKAIRYTGTSGSMPNAEYNVLQLKVTGWGKYALFAYLPIALKNVTLNNGAYNLSHLVGPTDIWYDSMGKPNYYRTPYILQVVNGKTTDDVESVSWSLVACAANGAALSSTQMKFAPSLVQGNVLQPLNLYVEDAVTNVCIIAKKDNQILWLQPLLIYQNKYPAAMLNKWDGSLQIDEENGTILASTIGAGKKESDNTFSGVLMGDVTDTNAESSLTSQTGLYGYHHGNMSYAFMQNGTAFIGKAGQSRIYFDGTDGTITSGSYENGGAGVLIDLDGNEGSNRSNFITVKGYSNDVTPKLNTILTIGDGSVSNYIQSANYQGNDPSGLKIDLNNGRLDAKGEFALTAGNNQIRLSTDSPYFIIKDDDLENLIYMGDNQYYLQSPGYVNEDSTGLKIDLLRGRLTAKGEFSLTAGENQVRLSTTSPYFIVKDTCASPHTLIYVGDNEYYLQSHDFSSTNHTGVKFDLDNGKLTAYTFLLQAGVSPNQFYLDTNNETWPFRIGDNNTSGAILDKWKDSSVTMPDNLFAINWDGSLIATGARIGGWICYEGYNPPVGNGNNYRWQCLYTRARSKTDSQYYYTVFDASRDNVIAIGITPAQAFINHNYAKFRVTNTGAMYCTDGYLGCALGDTATGGWHVASNTISSDSNNFILSAVNFTKTIASASRTDLRLAIGDNFGISNTGVIYSSGAQLYSINSTQGTFTDITINKATITDATINQIKATELITTDSVTVGGALNVDGNITLEGFTVIKSTSGAALDLGALAQFIGATAVMNSGYFHQSKGGTGGANNTGTCATVNYVTDQIDELDSDLRSYIDSKHSEWYNEGWSVGWDEGYAQGLSEGYDRGYSAGSAASSSSNE